MRRLRAIAALVLGLASAHAEPGHPSEKWETLNGCKLLRNDWNDGDSFHISHNGKEYIFRLYFVDTPETHDVSPNKSRTTEQAKYWGIRKKELYQLAAIATQFSAVQLSAAPFTVRTRWEDARGESQLPRSFAVIETANGDLAELLVSAGLARIYGHQIDHPRGISWKNYDILLHRLEARAKLETRGAWAVVAGKALPGIRSDETAGDDLESYSNGVSELPGY